MKETIDHNVHGSTTTVSGVNSAVKGLQTTVKKQGGQLESDSQKDQSSALDVGVNKYTHAVSQTSDAMTSVNRAGTEAIRGQNWAVTEQHMTNGLGASLDGIMGGAQEAGILPAGMGMYSQDVLTAWAGGDADNAAFLGVLDAERHGVAVDPARRAAIEAKIGPENAGIMRNTYANGFADAMPVPVGLPHK